MAGDWSALVVLVICGCCVLTSAVFGMRCVLDEVAGPVQGPLGGGLAVHGPELWGVVQRVHRLPRIAVVPFD